MSPSFGRAIAIFALTSAAMMAVPSVASATAFTMDTTVSGGKVGFDTALGSVSGTITVAGDTDNAKFGRLSLYGQASDKPNGTLTSLPVWCIDITDTLTRAKFVEKPLSWATTGGGGDVTYSTTQLNNVLKYLVFATGQGINNATTSAATQLGIWEILNEKSVNPTWNLGSGNFRATSSGSSATTLANSWLTSSTFSSTSTTNYSLVILDASAGNQMQAFLRYTAPVPEPESWMTMILGFGAIGWATRRRRAAGRAVA